MTGEWPAFQIDHINGDRADNRWTNLRLATSQENGFNRGKQRNNTSGFKGVSKATHGGWQASIWVSGKRTHLGYFKTAEAAGEAYQTAAAEMHGQFVRQI